MTLKFGGNYPEMVRVKTDLLSFDVAMAGDISKEGEMALGIPMRCLIYVFSKHTGIGKSALVFSLAARLSGSALPNSDVAVMPVDTFSRSVAEQIFEQNGADGYVEFIHELEHADGVSRLAEMLRDSRTVVGVLDSVSAFESTAVRESDSIEDANMGRNPFAISQMVSQLNGILKSSKQEKVVFLTSALRQSFDRYSIHKWFPKGGQAPYEKSSIHIDLNWTRVPNLIAFPGGRLITGEVSKNNFGVPGKVFRVFMVGGTGIHTGMTAAYDCVLFGLATGGKTLTDSFSINGAKIGTPKNLMQLSSSDPAFIPFYETLRNNFPALLSQSVTKKSVASRVVKKGKEVDADEEVVNASDGEWDDSSNSD